MEWKERLAGLRCLTALAPEGGSEVLGWLTDLVECLAAGDGPGALDGYTCLYRCLKGSGYSGLGACLWDVLRDRETVYGQASDPEESLRQAARAECALLLELAGLSGEEWKAALRECLPREYHVPVALLPQWEGTVPFDFETLTRFYREVGCGLFARNRAFVWNGGTLIPVADPDIPGPDEMMGYEMQRGEVMENTRALVGGKAVNNALLFGDGGTGKSATVKSLLGVSGFEALRLIEVEKDGVRELPGLIRSLGHRRQKFILFLDDLAFDRDDDTYGVLKTILEGGVEKRPDNVAIYATSNRRNLVRQTFSDRAGDEVDAAETVAEKTSLAERFGLRVAYLTLNKAEYLRTVDGLAALHGVALEQEELHRRALQWERYHHGCTPRTAKQFIASL